MCKKALIVCGNRLEQKITAKVLQENFSQMEEIRQVSTPEEGLTALEDFDPDLVLFDVYRSAAGLMNLSRIARRQNPEAVIILTSAKSETEILSLVTKCEADDYLLKPYSPHKMIETIFKCYSRNCQNGEELMNLRREEIRSSMMETIRGHLFKNSMNKAKEYIDSIFDCEDNEDVRYAKTSDFLGVLQEIAGEYSMRQGNAPGTELEEIKIRMGQWYDVYLAAENYLRHIYGLIDQEYTEGTDINKVLNYIDMNIRKGINLEEAANYINVSNCYFSKLFKKSTNVTFISYVTEGKMELARDMLTYTQMPIVNIAYELSYTDTNYFSKAFKKQTGVSPTEYRQTHSKVKRLA